MSRKVFTPLKMEKGLILIDQNEMEFQTGVNLNPLIVNNNTATIEPRKWKKASSCINIRTIILSLERGNSLQS